MPEFRTKSVVVEAIRYAGNGNFDPSGGEPGAVPEWLWKALEDGKLEPTNGADPLRLMLHGGDAPVWPGDWIIYTDGRVSLLTHDTFVAHYEPVQGPPSNAAREALANITTAECDALADALLDLDLGYQNGPHDAVEAATALLRDMLPYRAMFAGLLPGDDVVVVPRADYERLCAELDDAHLARIEAQNPGIDIKEVERARERFRPIGDRTST